LLCRSRHYGCRKINKEVHENALGFTLTYDPAVLGNPTIALGVDAAGGQLSTGAQSGFGFQG